jgi:U3 small nucleolar RNA-associated protein 15
LFDDLFAHLEYLVAIVIGRFWRRFKFPILQKLLSPPTFIQFSSVVPYDYAVTAGARVSVYDGKSNKEKKVLSKFKDVVASGSFRADSKLLVAGGSRGGVHVMEVATRSILRSFKGHRGPVNSTHFLSDNVHILSTGDDLSLRLWNLSTGKADLVIERAHEDYIRCACSSPSSPSIWVTGSYDHEAKVWDFSDYLVNGFTSSNSRTRNDEKELDDDEGDEVNVLSSDMVLENNLGENSMEVESVSSDQAAIKPIMTVSHGEPITCVLVLPGGSILLTCGGTKIKVWDILSNSTGTLLNTIEAHQKLITCITMDATKERILTGSLDGMVKIFHVNTFEVLNTLSYAAPILSLGISPDNTKLVVGCTDSMLSIRTRLVKVADILQEKKLSNIIKSGSYRYFLRGQTSTRVTYVDGVATTDNGDVVVKRGKKQKLQEYDKAFKAFKYAEALDSSLQTHDPVIVVSVLQELVLRDGISIALANRNEETLLPILLFLIKYIQNPKYTNFLLDICAIFLDMYSSILGQSNRIDTLVKRLSMKIANEVSVSKDLLQLQGVLDLLLASAS